MITLSQAEVRRRLVAHLGLNVPMRSVRAVLEKLRCIQLDPLDVIGTNADLVVMARVERAQRGDVHKRLFPRHAFEHFAKERCILPAEAFPYYREHGHGVQTPWWKHNEREERVAPEQIARVLDEVRKRGPIVAADLTDEGSVVPMDWSGWMGTSKATSMALEILWTRCDIVVAGRTDSGAKIYDLPERALGSIAREKPKEGFEQWALRERVRAIGLLSRSGGSTWSTLSATRRTTIPDDMVASGDLVDVMIEGSPRKYLAVPEFLERRSVRFDDRVRILGPLDPLMWDRDLIRHAFEFDYVWEVYKPAHLRKWAWYVCPILFRDRLIGRVDAKTGKLWMEGDADRGLVKEALVRYGLGPRRR